jgi:hypothetical protein
LDFPLPTNQNKCKKSLCISGKFHLFLETRDTQVLNTERRLLEKVHKQMDLIQIVPDDGEAFAEADGSDIDGEDMLDAFEDENDENDDRNDHFNVHNIAENAADEAGGGAPAGPPLGAAATEWTEVLTPVPNIEFTGKNELLVYSNMLLCHIIHFEHVWHTFVS